MYPAFPPVDVHITYVLYIYLLCMISLVLLYKKSPSMQPPYAAIFIHSLQSFSCIFVSKTFTPKTYPNPYHLISL